MPWCTCSQQPSPQPHSMGASRWRPAAGAGQHLSVGGTDRDHAAYGLSRQNGRAHRAHRLPWQGRRAAHGNCQRRSEHCTTTCPQSHRSSVSRVSAMLNSAVLAWGSQSRVTWPGSRQHGTLLATTNLAKRLLALIGRRGDTTTACTCYITTYLQLRSACRRWALGKQSFQHSSDDQRCEAGLPCWPRNSESGGSSACSLALAASKQHGAASPQQSARTAAAVGLAWSRCSMDTKTTASSTERQSETVTHPASVWGPDVQALILLARRVSW